MAAAFVQGTGIQSVGSVASVGKAFTSNVTAGNSIIVGGVTATADMPAGSVTGGGTYTRDVILQRATNERAAKFHAHSATGGATTVTLDATGSDVQSIEIEEVSGLDTAGTVVTASGSNASSGNPVTGNLVTSGNCYVSGVMTNGAGSATTMTPGGTYNQVFEDEDVTDMPINGMYKIVAAGTYTADWTMNAARSWVCVAAAYPEATASTITPDKWFARQDVPLRPRNVIAY
jgi:hypothetical protein